LGVLQTKNLYRRARVIVTTFRINTSRSVDSKAA
jgi:hypothetical protein